jgi:hypothetical protein
MLGRGGGMGVLELGRGEFFFMVRAHLAQPFEYIFRIVSKIGFLFY